MLLKRVLLWYVILCYSMRWCGIKCMECYDISILCYEICMLCYATYTVYVEKDKHSGNVFQLIQIIVRCSPTKEYSHFSTIRTYVNKWGERTYLCSTLRCFSVSCLNCCIEFPQSTEIHDIFALLSLDSEQT